MDDRSPPCMRPPKGWVCSLSPGHNGNCASTAVTNLVAAEQIQQFKDCLHDSTRKRISLKRERFLINHPPQSRHDLPAWEDCERAVAGGWATHLQTFIYHNEPADVGLKDAQTAAEFRDRLFNMLAFARQPAAEIKTEGDRMPTITQPAPVNGVATRAREYRRSHDGQWGSHGEALANEVDRLQIELHAARLLWRQRSPTHRCRTCSALWTQLPDGSWNLWSQSSGLCCDNIARGDQIEPLDVSDQLHAEIEHLKSLVYVPGLWHCEKCEFNSTSMTQIDDNIIEHKCTNCESSMSRVSERAAGNELAKRLDFAAAALRVVERRRDELKSELTSINVMRSFQRRVNDWMLQCFGADITADTRERNHRHLEESLELVQSLGCTESEAEQLVRYVYSRPPGDPQQEIGGVMVTLAALGEAAGHSMEACGEKELARVYDKSDEIRAKQAAKPKHSPLPAVVAVEAAPHPDIERFSRLSAVVLQLGPESKTCGLSESSLCALQNMVRSMQS